MSRVRAGAVSDTTIRVEVTAEDIAKGRPMDPESCPVARAMTGALHTSVRVTRARRDGHWVGVAELPFSIGGEPVRFRLSRSVGQFAWAFDHRLPVQPFTFLVVR